MQNKIIDLFNDIIDKSKKYIDDNTPLISNTQLNVIKNTNTILLIDGMNLFIRNYVCNETTNSHANYIGGFFGFINSMCSMIRKFNPYRCIIAFDGKNSGYRRRKIYPDYKAKRHLTSNQLHRKNVTETTAEEEREVMHNQLHRLGEYLKTLPVTILIYDNIEADDIIAYCVNTIFNDEKKYSNIIVSTDKDYLQLASANTSIWSPIKQILYGPREIRDEYNVSVDNFINYKIICGDTSDNITGVKGIGSKSIEKYYPILRECKYIDIDGIIDYAKDKIIDVKKPKIAYTRMIENRDILYRNYDLMQLKNPQISTQIKMAIRNCVLNTSIQQLDSVQLKQYFIEDDLASVLDEEFVDWMMRNFNYLNTIAIESNKR